jgi:hypothetical protein
LNDIKSIKNLHPFLLIKKKNGNKKNKKIIKKRTKSIRDKEERTAFFNDL